MNPSNERLSSELYGPILGSQRLIDQTFVELGDTLREAYGTIGSEFKDDGSIVTALDRFVENTVKDRLQRSFPEFGFKGEETGASGSAEQYWVVDPIDGTTAFVRGEARCTNMAAFILNGSPVASVMYDFVNQDSYIANLGEGAMRNDDFIRVSERPANEAYIDNDNWAEYQNISTFLKPAGVRLFQPLGATGMSLIHVATGHREGYLVHKRHVAEHDLMAGLLLATEAGAEVVPLDGKPFTPQSESFAVVNKSVADYLRDKVL